MSVVRGTLAAGVAAGLITVSAVGIARSQQPAANNQQAEVDGPLIQIARQATEAFQDVTAAEAAGYALSSGCVSGPEEGAMGVHYGNATLLGDGTRGVAT